MKCMSCGAQIPDDADFCTSCGERQEFNKTLIDGAMRGDTQAETKLYNATYNHVYALIKSMIKDEDTVLDLLQDSYVKAFRSLHQLQEANKFRPWLKTIAKNRTMDYFRERKQVLFSDMTALDDEDASAEFEDTNPDAMPDVVMDRQETARLLAEILDSLPDDQRGVISMFYYGQMSVKEIASALGLNEKTVSSRLIYGRNKIKTQMLELEKRGTKLYGLAPLPFLLFLLRKNEAHAMADAAASASLAQILQQTGQASQMSAQEAGREASGQTANASAPAAAQGTAPASFATGSAAGAAAAGAVSIKAVIAAVAAAIVVIAGAAIIVPRVTSDRNETTQVADAEEALAQADERLQTGTDGIQAEEAAFNPEGFGSMGYWIVRMWDGRDMDADMLRTSLTDRQMEEFLFQCGFQEALEEFVVKSREGEDVVFYDDVAYSMVADLDQGKLDELFYDLFGLHYDFSRLPERPRLSESSVSNSIDYRGAIYRDGILTAWQRSMSGGYMIMVEPAGSETFENGKEIYFERYRFWNGHPGEEDYLGTVAIRAVPADNSLGYRIDSIYAVETIESDAPEIVEEEIFAEAVAQYRAVLQEDHDATFDEWSKRYPLASGYINYHTYNLANRWAPRLQAAPVLYTLYDINGDGVREMLVMMDPFTEEYVDGLSRLMDTYESNYLLIDILTVKDREVRTLLKGMLMGKLFLQEDGLILEIGHNRTQSNESMRVFRPVPGDWISSIHFACSMERDRDSREIRINHQDGSLSEERIRQLGAVSWMDLAVPAEIHPIYAPELWTPLR